MKNFVIGDIHGNYLKLVEILKKTNPKLHEDKIIFLGDYIDRGGDSYKVIQLLKGLQEKYGKDHVILLRGNHEQMAIENINNKYVGSSNGYDATVKDFIHNGEQIENYLEFFKSLPLYHEDEHFIYVHAGIKPGISIQNQKEFDLLWIREDFFRSSTIFNKPIIFGHTPTCNIINSWDPFIRKDRIGIDTGLIFGGYLTAVEITNGNTIAFHQTSKLSA